MERWREDAGVEGGRRKARGGKGKVREEGGGGRDKGLIVKRVKVEARREGAPPVLIATTPPDKI